MFLFTRTYIYTLKIDNSESKRPQQFWKTYSYRIVSGL